MPRLGEPGARTREARFIARAVQTARTLLDGKEDTYG